MVYTSQFQKIDPYDWFCCPGSHIALDFVTTSSLGFMVFWEDVVSDGGPHFIFQFWRDFCRQIGASDSLSLGFHLQTNSQSEHVNLSQILRCLTSYNPSTWSQQLTWAEYAHNSLPVSSIGLSQFTCCLIYQPHLSPSLSGRSLAPGFYSVMLSTWRRAREVLSYCIFEGSSMLSVPTVVVILLYNSIGSILYDLLSSVKTENIFEE